MKKAGIIYIFYLICYLKYFAFEFLSAKTEFFDMIR